MQKSGSFILQDRWCAYIITCFSMHLSVKILQHKPINSN